MTRSKRWYRHLLGLSLPLLALGMTTGCNDYSPDDAEAGPAQRLLVAKQIESEDELIGGPSARGAVGDFLIQNDKVRFIIGAKRQTFMGGVFGGTLLDADLVRSRADQRYGLGWDAFSETFPLVNLLVTNPYQTGRDFTMGADGTQMLLIASGVEVLKDGSDGEAIIRVTGRSGYIFEMLKFLSKDFLGNFLTMEIDIAGLPKKPIDQIAKALLGINIYSLLNRLQLDFTFTNDYILRSGESYLTLKTTVTAAPPSETALERCPEVDCDLKCESGYALRETAYSLDPKKPACNPEKDLCGMVMCPACACAEAESEMATLNESEDIFNIMLGDLPQWKEQAWKGGVLGGDFLFMGSDVSLFSPGLGFDEQPKIFENLWQGVPTLASPLIFPWIAASGENVSYGWVTKNPDQRDGLDCPEWRIAITYIDYPNESKVIEILRDSLKFSEAAATAKVRQAIVDRRPIVLAEGIELGGAKDLAKFASDTLAGHVFAGQEPDPEKEGKFIDAEVPLAGLFPEEVKVELIPATACQSGKLLIPLFSTSATAVMTHKTPSSMDVVEGAAVDSRRSFTFERYFVVGDGDVGSVLKTIYDLTGEETGRVEGVVVHEGTFTPASHVSVVAIHDPRDNAEQPAFQTYDELREACLVRFGNAGFASQMQSDMGLDKVRDGGFGGPLLPGRYFLVGFTKGTGPSVPVPVEVSAGAVAKALVAIPMLGEVEYRIMDNGGQMVPSRITFVRLDEKGEPLPWQGKTYPELGGKAIDHGIQHLVHTTTGHGDVSLAPGDYEVFVSRGFEYSVWHQKPFKVYPGRKATLDAMLVNEVDTSGWISTDMHLHTITSIDSGVPIEERIAASVSEGVELIVATDHDYITFYDPFVNDLDIRKFIQGVAGIETSTLEFGHFNGFPLRYKQTDVSVHGAPTWYGERIGDVWDSLREMAAPGFSRDEVIIQVNHPRDGQMGYFGQMGLDPITMQRDTAGMSMCNPQSEVVSCEFDAMEVFNEKRFELLRTPTIKEIHWYNECMTEIYKASDPALFKLNDADPASSVCGVLQLAPYEECANIEKAVTDSTAKDMELAGLYAKRDHCRWHKEFADGMEAASKSGILVAKRAALDALKWMAVRYMIERMPEEQDAYFATAPENDIGCDFEKAMAGCTVKTNDKGEFLAGCNTEECVIESCVCATNPECCLAQGAAGDEGLVGTGWDEACVQVAVERCYACGVRPCTSKRQPWDDWFAFLNHGLNVTGVGNSDSHSTSKETGQPRNFVVSSTDDPFAMDQHEIFRNVKEHKVIVSTGPFARFSIGDAGVGDTLVKPQGSTLPLKVRIETASWIGVDRIEIHRNGKLEKLIRIDPAKEEIVDFDEVIEMPMPSEDSWYVLVAMGLDTQYMMTPVQKRAPWGQMLISSIIAMGGKSILLSFSGLISQVGASLVEGLIVDALGSEELPDVFHQMPLLITNPIWVDLDGDGFEPVFAVDADKDGKWDLPPFCSLPCKAEALEDEEGNFVGWSQSTCGLNQVCRPDAEGSNEGLCVIPIPDNCVGDQTK